MIGVVANPSETTVVREFFELFKTPWEWYQSGKPYEVLLSTADGPMPENEGALVLRYAGRRLSFEPEGQIENFRQAQQARMLKYEGQQIPVYGDCALFQDGTNLLVDEETGRPAIRLDCSSGRTVARIGYDLFGEVRRLLTAGQPATNAGIPALELHISLLRDLIINSGAPLAEIPPVPEGYRFIACLTHDVDHPSIRRHKFDHTTLGFLYRAVLGSLVKALTGRMPARDLLNNWAAALKLPLVHLGLAKDFWYDFDHYVELEEGAPSTFFIIPFKNCAGRLGESPAPSLRAAGYGAADIAEKIRTLMSTGCEVGLHGIDAWLDSSSGWAELEAIRQVTGTRDIGVRMHWLYFGEESPSALDRAGADYDSTIGYNETVGYRAGTTQAFRPLGATRLLELPLHIMDTALFFPSHLDLSPREARERTVTIIENAVKFGGVVTVNWHDRSIGAERCWGGFYADLVKELKNRGAWFATAAETVSWFRKRRTASFETAWGEVDKPRIRAADGSDGLPGLQLRAYEGRGTAAIGSTVQIGSHLVQL